MPPCHEALTYGLQNMLILGVTGQVDGFVGIGLDVIEFLGGPFRGKEQLRLQRVQFPCYAFLMI